MSSGRVLRFDIKIPPLFYNRVLKHETEGGARLVSPMLIASDPFLRTGMSFEYGDIPVTEFFSLAGLC